MYIILFIVLLAFLIFNNENKQSSNVKYKLALFLLWLFLAFRYGQGTDYFSYYYIHSNNTTLHEAFFNTHATHSEIGFRLLCWLFKYDYTYLVFFVSTIEMIMLHRFIKNYSTSRIMSLLLVYPTIYLTYFFSAMREGIVISLFIGIMIECLEKGNKRVYYILSLLCCSIHIVSILFFMVPFIIKIDLKKMIRIAWIALAFGIVSWIMRLYNYIQFIPIIGMKIVSYSPQISMVALLERLLMLILALYLLQEIDIEASDNSAIVYLFKIYSFGFICYAALLCLPLVSSRTAILFKVVEIVLIPLLYSKTHTKPKDKQLIIALVVVVATVMTIKNINSYISQGKYHSNINFVNYPYVSVFDKDEIWKYRDGNIYYDLVD